MYCHSVKDCNAGKKREMLAFVEPESFETLGIVAPTDPTAPKALVPTRTAGQTVVLLGKMQEQVDRLAANPGGAWDTVVNVGEIACALCTAASEHETLVVVAREMLGQLLCVSKMSGEEKEHAARGFQHAQTALDPLMKVKGLAEGLSGKREQELMVIREAIVANTDAALEADVRNAAEAMLLVLDDYERRDAQGKLQPNVNFADLGAFFYFVWRRVARYGFDGTQHTEANQYTFFLFNGATYQHGKRRQFLSKAKEHVRRVVSALIESPQLESRARSLAGKCTSSDLLPRALAEMHESLTNDEKLARCGLISPQEFQLKLDTGNYIGFKNGVYDILHDRFMPKGTVPFNVLVSMCTNYDYVGPDDAKFPEMLGHIECCGTHLFWSPRPFGFRHSCFGCSRCREEPSETPQSMGVSGY
jgi:hypothetical protein